MVEKLETKSKPEVKKAPESQSGGDSNLDMIDATINAIDSLEVIPEGASEDSGGGGASSAAGQKGDDGKGDATVEGKQDQKPLPQPRVMIRKIQSMLHREVKTLTRQARGKLSRKAAKGMAYDLNEAVGKIRKLRITLARMVTASYEYVKALYTQLFKPKGS